MTDTVPITTLRTRRRCPSCDHDLPLEYFRQKQRQCDVCLDAARQARPWSAVDIHRMRLATREIGRYYSAHWTGMTERERDLFRELINAIDRRPNRDTD